MISEEENIKVTMASIENIKTSITETSTTNSKLEDLDYIPAYKMAEKERRENEEVRVANEKERIEYINSLKQMVADGKLNGCTFIPSIDTEGFLSWKNNGDLINPEPVSLMAEVQSLTNSEIEELLSNQI